MLSSVRMFTAALPLMVYRAANGGMPILLGLFIAYRWGVEVLASFTVASAAIAIGLVISDWGATRALPRNLATLPAAAAAEMLATANLFRLLLIGVLLTAGAVAAATGAVDISIVRYLAILFPLCPLTAIATNALSERIVACETRGVGVAVGVGLLLFAVLGGAVLALRLGPLWFVAAYIIGKTAETLVMMAGRWWVVSVRAHGMRDTALALWPFSMQMILAVIYTRLAVFTVERAVTRSELGVFSLAVALQTAIMLIPSSLALLLFPEMTQKAQQGDGAGVRRLLIRYTIASAASVALGVVCVGLVVGRFSARAGVPEPFVPFVVVYTALACIGIFSMISGFLMQSRGKETLAARLSVVTLSLALVYQVVALRAWGLWGIVAAVGAAELTTIVIFGLALRWPRRA